MGVPQATSSPSVGYNACGCYCNDKRQAVQCTNQNCRFKEFRNRNDHRALGAHYQHVSPPLPEDRGHNVDPSSRQKRDEKDERFLNEMLLLDGCSTPRSATPPRASTPRSGKAVPFTDRSVRKREGMGVAAVLLQEDLAETNLEVLRQEQNANAKLLMPPAGVRSKDAFTNKVPRCGQGDRVVPSSPRVPDNLRSEKMGPLIAWEAVDEDEEEQARLNKEFPRKARDQRGGSPGNRNSQGSVAYMHRGLEHDDAEVHGQRVNHRRGKRSVSPRFVASGAAGGGGKNASECGSEPRSIISHEASASNATPRSQKKEAVYSVGLSADSERHALREQNHMFRYECWRGAQRSAPGAPPAHCDKAYDLLSPKGIPLSPRKRPENVVPVEPGQSAGDCMDHHRMRANIESESNARMAKDTPFADLVAQTRQQAKVSRDHMQAVRSKHASSSQAASALHWNT